MYQFSPFSTNDERLITSVTEAISQGITWIELQGDVSDHVYAEVEKECKKNGIILTLTDARQRLEEKKFHGVLIPVTDIYKIEEIRENLGGHPIIGVLFGRNDSKPNLNHLDIDYIAFDFENKKEALDFIGETGEKYRFPIVARGFDISSELSEELLKAGYNGICKRSRV